MRIFLIDEDFRDFSGHHASYDLPIFDELKKRSIESRVFVHSRAQVPPDSSALLVRTFRKSRWTRKRLAKFVPNLVLRLLELASGNVLTLADLVQRVTPMIRCGDILLICRPNSQTRLAYSLWSLWLSLKKLTVTQVYVFHNLPHRLFKLEAFLLNVCARDHRITYVAHSAPLADLCRRLTHQDCHLLPLPFANHGQAPHGACDRFLQPVSFVYLGQAHYTKGLDTLLAAIELLEAPISKGEIRFVIQCYGNGGGEVGGLQRALLVLSQTWAGISVISTPLVPEEYLETMGSACIVLIPHRLEYYGLALSGIFAEALGLGKPVIVSEDTHMAEQMKLYGAGVTFRSGDAQSLAQAIRVASKDIEELTGRAAAARSRWLSVHNPEAFADGLVAAIRRAG